MKLYVDTNGKQVTVTKDPVAKTDGQTDRQKTERGTGRPMWSTQVFVLDDDGGEVITVTTAGEKPNVKVGRQSGDRVQAGGPAVGDQRAQRRGVPRGGDQGGRRPVLSQDRLTGTPVMGVTWSARSRLTLKRHKARERIIPLSDWDIQAIRRQYPPRPYTLPWEKPGGKPHTCSILFRWPTDGQHVKARSFSETIWKPALVKAGVIAQPDTDRRSRRRYVTTRREGIHQLRHYYASVMLAGGVSIKELAEYLGHSDPAFTLRVYAHMLPCSHDRARAVISERFTRVIGPGS